jgi:hypothetical protein
VQDHFFHGTESMSTGESDSSRSLGCGWELSPIGFKEMATQRLTTYGLRLYRDEDGTHWLHLGEKDWLHLGEKAVFCVENLSTSEATTEWLHIWLQAQVPINELE